MTDTNAKEWVLPALIPFADLKRKDLEECVYWLFDALGAKDLEWRTGGSGIGAADGGRDLEARFYTPGADSEIESQTWWVECKGRAGTVEADDVRSAVVNAQAKAGLDYLVIATNTQFSNPTRDWVKEWQVTHPRPKIRLWDNAQLERLLSRHPDVVLRLFSQALSLQGRFQAMESRFWNNLEFVPPKALADLWKGRREIEFTAMGTFAAVVNEFANGSISHRPWGALADPPSLIGILHLGLINASYLMMRSYKGGVDDKPIYRAYAYLILCAIDRLNDIRNVFAHAPHNITMNNRKLWQKVQTLSLIVYISSHKGYTFEEPVRKRVSNRSRGAGLLEAMQSYALMLLMGRFPRKILPPTRGAPPLRFFGNTLRF